MPIFSTEFPVSEGFGRPQFIASVVSWLRGIDKSRILDQKNSHDFDHFSADLNSESGESLALRELEGHPQFWAIGFRYDNPEPGRLWRTEGVLRKSHAEKNGWFRIKTHCIATAPLEATHFPKKPFLIKSLIQDQEVGEDGLFKITDKPYVLRDSKDLDIAQAIIQGTATNYLPVVYISASADRPRLSKRDIEKLSYDLGGVAHVVVEPSRAFSFALRDIATGKNVYGGYTGVFLPDTGFQVRIYPQENQEDYREKIREMSLVIRSQMPKRGWDWIDFHEENTRALRKREKIRLKSDEIESLYIEELKAKDEHIKSLEFQLSQRPMSLPKTESEHAVLNENFFEKMGPEIYEGEFSDRIRYAIHSFLENSESQGVDKRTIAVLECIINCTTISSELKELLSELSRAAKDPKKSASLLVRLLERCGYYEKSDNKHIRLEANSGFVGLDAITLPKTPSDHRGSKNMTSDIERTLGINKLDFKKDPKRKLTA